MKILGQHGCVRHLHWTLDSCQVFSKVLLHCLDTVNNTRVLPFVVVDAENF